MSRIRGNGLKPERVVAAALADLGLRARRNIKSLPGSPDFVLDRERIALFVHGCFWHACPKHLRMPRTRREFWAEKFAGNSARDARAARALRRSGWSVLTVWEHDTRRGIERVILVIRRKLARARTSRARRGR